MHTKTRYNQAIWRESPESSKTEATCQVQGILSKTSAWFMIWNHGDQKAVRHYIESGERYLHSHVYYSIIPDSQDTVTT